jgi:hypothetical protein
MTLNTNLRSSVQLVDYSDQIIESLVDEMEKFSALFESIKNLKISH